MLCVAVTKKDIQCSNRAKPGSDLCGTHLKSKTVLLVSRNDPDNDSSEDDEATPEVDDLIKAVKDMGLESNSPNVDDGYETPWEQEIRVEVKAACVFRSGNAKIRENGRGRCKSEGPELTNRHFPECAVTKDVSSAQSTPSRAPKLRVSTANIAPGPHVALAKSPTNDVPPRLDGRLRWELSRIMVQPPDENTGIVYICDVQHEPRRRLGTRVIKIGFTCDINRRLKGHLHSCAWTRLQLLDSYPRSKPESGTYKQVQNCYQVEKLIHKTLEDFRYDKKCGCGRNHKELFEIGDDDDLEYFRDIVEHWVSWSERKLGHVVVPRGG
ncbi:T5orf172 domain-containing protein [Aspergillus novoparasiticus]|uniref:T5orf172 domain-containing protein n=1 Tax=Aspergillus novoparasiticus TaxID=986946 RepID=A0A5N6F7Q0_9EURO|nr:T5orf172 domain-containing protein [Aspergillus novoparasiticus]